MLVLSRFEKESIDIGDDVRITIVRVNRKGKVTIGIEAPEEVVILRSEITEREARCPHGNPASECDACFRESDFQFDVSRER